MPTTRWFAVVAVAAAMCGGCGGDDPPRSGATRHIAPSQEPPSSAGAVGPADGLFSAPQPWTADVSDFSLPVFVADATTPRMPVVGTGDYCFGGPDCDAVPAEMPVPEDANIEGAADLTCDISGDTDGGPKIPLTYACARTP
jgi:serine/threonine-protein kinase